jgi:hypothetical protein
MLRTILTIVGTVILLFGALFLCQGLGLIRWPASSFMIDNRVWITNGAIIAGAGIAILAFARLVLKKKREGF